MWAAAVQQVTSACEALPGWSDVLWDPTKSAGNYATLAALLAGFSVSGLLWISTSSASERAAKLPGIVGIWASLVPLVLSTLMFAEIAGDANCDQAAIETTVALHLFIVGTVSVVVSLSRLLTRVFDDVADRLAAVVSWTAILMGTAGIYAGNSTTLTLLEGEVWDGRLAAWGQVAVLLAGLIVCAWRWWRRAQGVEPLVWVVAVLNPLGFGVFYFMAFGRRIGWATAISWGRVALWCAFVVAVAAIIPTRAPNSSGTNHEVA